MNRDSIKPYLLTNEKEESLWNKAIIVFDSSALLDIYFVPKVARSKIYSEIFEKLPNRLWIPSHVEFEYLKNREDVIDKPIFDKYTPLKNKIKEFVKIKSMLSRIDEISNDTRKDDNHPYIEQNEINKLKNNIEKILPELNSFEANVLKQIDEAETEIKTVKKSDDLLEALEKSFNVGREYSFDEIIEITKEGKHRYECRIPPGYGDIKDKKGVQIFGDLIIWKQILEFSKDRKLPILLITNDVKKDNDWCYIDTRSRIISPREELIKEIKDYSSVDFWMYNLEQFLYNAKEYLKSDIEKETIQNIYQILNTKDFFSEIDDGFYTCHICSGNKDNFGNYVDFYEEISLHNEYGKGNPNHKYKFVRAGNCQWCNSLHIICPHCSEVTAFLEENKPIECEGGCGLTFYKESGYALDGEDESILRLLDHRKPKSKYNIKK
ncbi:MAG: PIN-like domain-containing protein [Firmicutes bacterium]|nr:PIN-like domain-containing protein [Bacillota bacterium]